MVCLGFEPGVAGWKAQMNPLSYGGTPKIVMFVCLKRPNINAKKWPVLAQLKKAALLYLCQNNIVLNVSLPKLFTPLFFIVLAQYKTVK